MLPDGNRPSTGYAKFDAARDGDDAGRHLAHQRRAGEAQPRARDRADDIVRDGRATARSGPGTASSAWSRSRAPRDDQLTTLYSNLYRLNLYPNSAFENTGTARAARVRARRCSRRRTRATRRDRREGRARQDVRQQRVLGHLPDRLAGLLAALRRATRASWSTASCSSTATAAGSPAGPRRATRT